MTATTGLQKSGPVCWLPLGIPRAIVLECGHGVIGSAHWVRPSNLISTSGKDSVVSGTFDEKNRAPIISMPQAQCVSLNHSANGHKKCQCQHNTCGPAAGVGEITTIALVDATAVEE